jgi:hypothetical protein
LSERTILPVIKSMRKTLAAATVEAAIASMDEFQWKSIAGSNTPAAYLRRTLDNEVAWVRRQQGQGEDAEQDEDEDEDERWEITDKNGFN